MNFFNKSLILIIITFSGFTSAKVTESTSCPSLSDVIESYQTSVAQKNEQEFLNLFLSYSIPWVGVNPAKRMGNLPSNEGLIYGAVPGFTNWLVNSGIKFEETMTDIKINTDGNVASVFYKYEFLLDNKTYSTGYVSWSLIKTTDCWKIASKIYSENR